MVVYGTGHIIERNTIALNIWPGTYEGRNEVKNVDYQACFEMVEARNVIFKDNVVRILLFSPLFLVFYNY